MITLQELLTSDNPLINWRLGHFIFNGEAMKK